jgi:hypothetical protein
VAGTTTTAAPRGMTLLRVAALDEALSLAFSG